MVNTTNYQVKWLNHSMHLLSRYGYLLENEILVDLTLMCNDKSLKVHRSVLAACSPYFEHVLQTELGNNPLIVLKDIEFVVLRSLVEFMYYGETQIPEDDIGSFVEAAKFFEIKGLSDMSIPNTGNTLKKVNPFTSDNICFVSGFTNTNTNTPLSSNGFPPLATTTTAMSTLPSNPSSLSSSPTASSSLNFLAASTNVSGGVRSQKTPKKRRSRGNSLSQSIASDDSLMGIPHAEESAKILLSLAGSTRNFHLFATSADDNSSDLLLNGNTRDSLNETPISNCEPSESGYKSDSVSSSLDSFTNIMLSSKSDTESSCGSLFRASPAIRSSPKIKRFSPANRKFVNNNVIDNLNNIVSSSIDVENNMLLIDNKGRPFDFLNRNTATKSNSTLDGIFKIVNAAEMISETPKKPTKLQSSSSALNYPFENSDLNWDNPIFINSSEISTIEKFDLNDEEVTSLTDGKQFPLPNLIPGNEFQKFGKFQKTESKKKENSALELEEHVLERIRNESVEDPEAVTLFRHNSDGKLEKFIISSKEIESLKILMKNQKKPHPPQVTKILETEFSINNSESGDKPPVIARVLNYEPNNLDEIILKKLPFKKAIELEKNEEIWNENSTTTTAAKICLDLRSSLVHSENPHENMLEELNHQFPNDSSIDDFPQSANSERLIVVNDDFKESNGCCRPGDSIVERAFQDIIINDVNSLNYQENNIDHLLDHEYLFFRKNSSRHHHGENLNSISPKDVLSKDVLISSGVSPILNNNESNNIKNFSILSPNSGDDSAKNSNSADESKTFERISFDSDCDNAIYGLNFDLDDVDPRSSSKRKFYNDTFFNSSASAAKKSKFKFDNCLEEEVVFDELHVM